MTKAICNEKQLCSNAELVSCNCQCVNMFSSSLLRIWLVRIYTSGLFTHLNNYANTLHNKALQVWILLSKKNVKVFRQLDYKWQKQFVTRSSCVLTRNLSPAIVNVLICFPLRYFEYDWSEFIPQACLLIWIIMQIPCIIRPCKFEFLLSKKNVKVFRQLDYKRRGPNGVFWGRVGLFGLNLHFYFGLLVAGKEKQHLNGKEPEKEEKGE